MNHTASPTPSHANIHAYTPLECLLLFQSLLSFGTREEDFVRISDALTHNELVKGEPTYEAQRLSVDALRQLYVQLLHEEVKTDGPEDVQEDGTQSGTKKRKIPSPSLPAPKDVQQCKEKLPLMVDRLYARYRERMIQSIRDEERRYAQVKREIQEIEQGLWDDRIREEDREIQRKAIAVTDGPTHPRTNGVSATPTPIDPPPPPPESKKSEDHKPHENVQPSPVPSESQEPRVSPKPLKLPTPPVAQPPAPQKSEGISLREVLNTPQPEQAIRPPPQQPPNVQTQPQNYSNQPPQQPLQSPHPLPHPVEVRSATGPSGATPHIPLNGPNGTPNSSFNGPSNGSIARPPPKRQPSTNPQQQIQHSPQLPSQSGTQFQWHHEQPYPPPQQMQQPHYQGGNSQQQHYNGPKYPPQYTQVGRGNFPPPHGFPPPNHHVPSSPSPLGSQHPSPVNTQHPSPLNTQLPPPLNTQHSPHMHHQQGILLPPPNGVARSPGSPGMPLDALADMAGQQYRPPPPSSPMTAHSPQMQPPPQGYHMQPPPMGHPMQYQQRQAPNVPSNGQPHGPPQWNQNFPPPQYHPPQGPYPPQFQPSPNQRLPYPAPAPLTQVQENRQYNSPYNPSVAGNQTSKPVAGIPQSLSKPRPSQPNTPLNQKVLRFTTGSGTRWTPTPTPSTPGRDRVIQSPAVEPISPILKPASLPPATKKVPTKQDAPKSEPKKAGRPRPIVQQRTRAGSTASSVVPGSNRSQSVASQVDDDFGGRQVKQEVATPIGLEDGGDTTADEFVARPKPRPSPQKRKHAASIRTSSNSPAQVLWMRNFPKISQSALEGVAAHKNASMFAAPIKERDAPGYKNLILRPQDLKSIRSAINAGHRAATSLAPSDMNPSATNVWLPISEDLIPPKGIINNAQLEKELMRMFANAIMFNADPDRGLGKRLQDSKGKGDEVLGYEIDEDGVVKDTRAMFADVEKLVMELRSTERKSEERPRDVSLADAVDDDEDELVGDEGSVHFGSLAKRRRKG